jgi:hypothetical protein
MYNSTTTVAATNNNNNNKQALSNARADATPSAVKLRKLYQDNPRLCFEDRSGRIYGMFHGTMRSGNTLDMWIVVPPIRFKSALNIDVSDLETRYRPPTVTAIVSLWRSGAGGAGDGLSEYCQIQLLSYTSETRRTGTAFRVQALCIACVDDDAAET